MKKELIAELKKPFINGLPKYLRMENLNSETTHLDLIEYFAQHFSLFNEFNCTNNKYYIRGLYVSYYPSKLEYEYFLERRNYYVSLQDIVNELIENFELRLKELNIDFLFLDTRDEGRNEASFLIGKNKAKQVDFQLNLKNELPEIHYNHLLVSFDTLLEKMNMN